VSNSEKYDRWSAFYDAYPNPTVAVDDLHFPAFYTAVRDLRVLEIGCGTGRHTVRLVEKGNVVTAVDSSVGMLAQARAKMMGHAVRFVEMDFARDGAAGLGTFDAIVESLVLEHIESLGSFYAKAATVLETGGEMYLSEIHPLRAEQGVLAHFRDPESGEDIPLVSYAHGEDEFVREAEQAGFRLVEQQDVAGDSIVHLRAKWSRYTGMPMIRMWRFVFDGR